MLLPVRRALPASLTVQTLQGNVVPYRRQDAFLLTRVRISLKETAACSQGQGASSADSRRLSEPSGLSLTGPSDPLFEAYESNLAESGFTDWAGVLTTATDALFNDSFTNPLLGLPTILLD